MPPRKRKTPARPLGIPVRVVYRPDWEAAGEPYTGIPDVPRW
ncbi:hypothetical protein SEA_TARDUS_77 [Gordonia phage Tardus]|uniref:Uncharacterized protein n=1 Tax=Gordonia phage Tardus TaxID=2939734 RepID=A0A9E7J7F5_9CAUD|nr:hypothetical protein SEA_TARDUS_77 [Gordonia phage Tardus]